MKKERRITRERNKTESVKEIIPERMKDLRKKDSQDRQTTCQKHRQTGGGTGRQTDW